MALGRWGGYSNGRIPLSAMVRVGGAFFKPDVARQVAWALAECARRGVRVTITEGYRSIGVPADQYDHSPATTSDGTTNQWYQVGRRNRGLTPSAATPGHSNHGWAEAGDFAWTRSRTNDAIVRAVFKQAGLLFTIASEWWHADASGTITANIGATTVLKTQEEEDDMKPMLLEIHNANGSKQWALVPATLDGFVPIWKADTANSLSKRLDGFVIVSKDEWNGFRAAAGLPADTNVG
jgi:hypothetical protein